MSIYSGKCDIYDHFAIATDGDENKLQEEIERTDFYRHGKNPFLKHKLDIHTPKDLVPYYPYLMSTGAWGSTGRAHIELSSESL